jgi:alpha-beta hydrolase superfamily lysophospholipase
MQSTETDDVKKRNGYLKLPRLIRLMFYLPLLALLILLGLRQLEHMVTYHPRPYSPGPRWNPPANAEEVWIKVENGQRIHGWFVRAPQQAVLATVLYCHGNGGDLTDVAWIAEDLASRGYATLIFDYRGYGRSDGILRDEWTLYADAESAYDFLIRERGAAPRRSVIYGQSLGTTVAIELSLRRECAALIVESGLSSASDMGAAAFPWLPRWLHSLSKNRFESVRKIANVKCPVFISHGTADNVIPVEQGRRLFAAAPEPKRLMIVEGGGHNLVGSGNVAYLDSVAKFIGEAMREGQSAGNQIDRR